ncbi:MAG: chromosome segregation protein SMC [Streptosporangiales bacterium]|nr:chromosome segregation protein SMC [Streptosporangiales bacterium]
MYLKSLTLRGFKSFASSTMLRFETGITCVVGPNGSGKSNVVDALAWVMGEQGAKSLRGGKMEDVIFAGTASRPPLGRAEVALTIDNSDGALPIEYSEVTISRLMFRSGQSEYAINGNACRLLDVQELLSDSGIGREMHVVVGQGQLDTVLHAGPEERRALIEEAAGVLKHRKRKEKALRKLDAMQGNLTRLQDLTAELRRQLKPLGRQAEIARKAAVIQADLRDARLRLLADDVVTLRTTLERDEANEAAVRERRDAVEAALGTSRAREAELDAQAQAEAPRLAQAQETWYRLSSLRERLRSTASLAAERHRNLSDWVGGEGEEERRSRDPEELEREAAQVREQEGELTERLEEAREGLREAVRRRSEAEAALKEEERQIAAAVRAAADRREGLAKLRGQVAAMRSRATAAEEEIGRLARAVAEARERAERAEAEYEALERQIAGQEEGEVGLDAAHERAQAELAAAGDRVAELRREEQDADRERSALTARKEALEMSLARDGEAAEVLLAAGERLSGLLGSVAVLLTVEQGAETAVAAALGAAADAVAVSSVEGATEAIALLKEEDAGRAGIVIGNGPDLAEHERAPLPGGARYAMDLVSVPPDLEPAVRRLLADVVVVDDLATARTIVEAHPELRAVTRDGDLLGAHWSHGGSASAPSLIETQAAVDEAAERLAEVTERGNQARAALDGALEEQRAAAERVEETLVRLNESDAQMAAIGEHLGQLGSAARAAIGEAERLAKAITAAEEARDRDLEGLAALEERLTQAEAEPDRDTEPSTEERDALAEECTAARSAEMEARLTVRTAEERARAIAGRADALDRAAVKEREARERAVARRERRRRQAAVARAVALGAEAALGRIETSLQAAMAERQAAEQSGATRDSELKALRGKIRELSEELEGLVGAVHGREVSRAEQRLRLEQMETRAVEEFGIEMGTLITEYAPDVPVPPGPNARDDAEPTLYVREEQEKRAKAAERQLQQLGKVNPLALEEYAALEERHSFLTTQLEDLKKTRRDLLTVIKEVDDRVEQVFAAAFDDTAREFTDIFSRLFPGGDGRLVLTEPDDMLTTGVEVEARPPGKKIKRLSLLSGGERSLTALAYLIAIFKARPSPFYVLDEVEAALDDTNLQRVLTIFEELRESSQLLVITHQKRTMEVADALYGVSMRGDGVTTVISQRMREPEPA